MLRIGHITLPTNLLLAPIAGYCDLAFRTVCREWGGVGLACTDLLSPQGLLRGTATSLDLAKTNDFDKPVGMQLYGSDPEIMAEGARWAVEHGATIVDINMGCPVDKVTKKDGGSKLLTDLSRAVAIAERVRKELDKLPLSEDEWQRRQGPEVAKWQSGEVAKCGHESVPSPHFTTLPLSHSATSSRTVPLTCKMRLCWHDADYQAGNACSPHLARALADVGVAAVTVHGRTTEMKFSGECQRPGIARVVEAVNGAIPVIGNGDVREAVDAVTMIRETGCQGVMIGRGALSTPWIFRDCWTLLTEGYVPAPPGETEILGTMRRYFDLMRQTRDDRYAMFQINRRVTWFAKRLGPCKPFKEAVRTARAPDEVYAIFDRYLAGDLRGGRHEVEEQEA
ncbi:MAG TPA: tRNA-dihydrouridine synthase [Phycisphaerales bacterium]|nr:tRNA-dihydrouridine synthase [Phycisphaerales bacterium]